MNMATCGAWSVSSAAACRAVNWKASTTPQPLRPNPQPRRVARASSAEARAVLARDQRSSALSVGMMCGFGSQSAFYAAFREVTGESPAAFRKKQAEA